MPNRPLSVILTPGPSPHLRASLAIRRRLHRGRREQVAAQVLASVDRAGFERKFGTVEGQDSRLESQKFRDLQRGVQEAVDRYYLYGFDRLPRSARVLDLGCGSGYFLLVCRHHGHPVMGLDIPIDHIYDEMLAFLGLERYTHWISPANPLPEVDGTFGLVTAFLTTFNKEPKTQAPWGSDDWAPFLDTVHGILDPGGQLFLKLNRNKVIDAPYPPEVGRFFDDRPDYATTRFADCVRLVAR